MDKEVEERQRDEAFFLDYYNSIPKGERGDFLLVLRIVLDGSEFRWLRRFAAWRTTPISRKLFPYEIEKLSHLTTNDQWRETLRIVKKLFSR